MTRDKFRVLLESLGAAWQDRRYEDAVKHFAPTIRYLDPLRYSISGRDALLAFFRNDGGYPQSTKRRRLLTFSHLIFSFEPGFITSFQGDTVTSMMLARFLRLFSPHGGSLPSSTSGADRPLPGTLPSFRQVSD